jgi:hypothetical protein
MKSGIACFSFGEVSVVSSEGGGAGGAGVDDGICSSARATAEDERNRRGVPLAVGSCRTHRRHVLNCRSDGVTGGAMAISDRGDEGHAAMRGQNVDAVGLCGETQLSATSAATAPLRPEWLPREFPRPFGASHHNWAG